jgi:osmotically-inducible protein OsmY
MQTERELQSAIEAALASEASVSVEALGVRVQKCSVQLTGAVASELEKWRAGVAVRQVPGVILLDNNLHVTKNLADLRDGTAGRC